MSSSEHREAAGWTCPNCRPSADAPTAREHAYRLHAPIDNHCATCDGHWLARDAFDTVIAAAKASFEQAGAEAPTRATRRELPRGEALSRVRYLRCPVCDEWMSRKNFGGSSGVIVDQCFRHGTWLDRGELPALVDFVRSGGLSRKPVRPTTSDDSSLALGGLSGALLQEESSFQARARLWVHAGEFGFTVAAAIVRVIARLVDRSLTWLDQKTNSRD